MDTEQLRRLLAQEESPTLEFKSEPYHIDSADMDAKKRQRDEMIKDVLALANGNATVAGETAYLILGADDRLNSNGTRLVQDVGLNSLPAKRILDLVNSACAPRMEDLVSESVLLDGKRLIVITIPASPHLYETTRKLEPSTSGVVSEFAVFIRHGAGVKIASAKEREAIAQLKRLRFNEAHNPPPEPFGALVGAVIGAGIASDAGRRLGNQSPTKQVWGVTGTIVGAISGWLMGRLYRDIQEIKSALEQLPRMWRVPALALLVGWLLAIWAVISNVTRRMQKR